MKRECEAFHKARKRRIKMEAQFKGVAALNNFEVSALIYCADGLLNGVKNKDHMMQFDGKFSKEERASMIEMIGYLKSAVEKLRNMKKQESQGNN